MIAQVIIENGQKKIIPLTADAGAGNPVGSLLHTYKKSNPSGYLYCDGSTFDQTKYPLLYAYLGTNVLPDYREVVEVGAEQNTTDTIADHDVYTEGQFKDDQLQDYFSGGNLPTYIGGEAAVANLGGGDYGFYVGNQIRKLLVTRRGTTTHGKQKAVFVYIKATSGLSENAQDNVINTLNEQRSYSTEEVNTGKKWIDGKPIYRRVAVIDNNITNYMVIMANVPIDTLISTSGSAVDSDNGNKLPIPFVNVDSAQSVSFYFEASDLKVVFHNTTLSKIIAVIEYTKTN